MPTYRRALVGLAVTAACLLGSACGSAASHRVGIHSGGDVNVLTATPAVLASLPATFLAQSGLPDCPAVIVPGTAKFALQTATNDTWAIAQMMPAPGCRVYNGKEVIAPDDSAWFSYNDGRPWMIFERPNGGAWSLNDDGTVPFPCPDFGGREPGFGIPAVPEEVLQAWGVAYAQNCKHAKIPEPPGRNSMAGG